MSNIQSAFLFSSPIFRLERLGTTDKMSIILNFEHIWLEDSIFWISILDFPKCYTIK